MRYYTSDGCTYFGMDSDTVTTLRAGLGLTTTFVDQPTYDAYIQSIRIA